VGTCEQADKIKRIREREYHREKEIQQQQRDYYEKVSATQVTAQGALACIDFLCCSTALG